MNINQQNPEKPDHSIDGSVVVHSMFYTIQGEGPFAGEPAIFIRLAGCNLQCPACDTEYTSKRLRMDPAHVLREVYDIQCNDHAIACKLVVITGGEPFRQNLLRLVRALIEHGFNVQIETNGSLFQELPFESNALTVVCSPKTSVVHRLLVPHVKAFKYVATEESLAPDGLPANALEHPNAKGLFRPPHDWRGTIYLQPVDEQNELKNGFNQKAVIRSCMRHGYRLCLQLHKIIGLD